MATPIRRWGQGTESFPVKSLAIPGTLERLAWPVRSPVDAARLRLLLRRLQPRRHPLLAARPQQPRAAAVAVEGSAPRFPESLVNDVVPYIEKNFRVIPNKDSRAIAGLSMGGGHTLTATNAHPDVFSYVGVFSMGTAADVSDKLEALKKAGVKYYYVGHGKDDPVVRVAQGQNLAAQLQKVGINYHYTESSGGHTWSNWRIYLCEFTPLLFR